MVRGTLIAHSAHRHNNLSDGNVSIKDTCGTTRNELFAPEGDHFFKQPGC